MRIMKSDALVQLVKSDVLSEIGVKIFVVTCRLSRVRQPRVFLNLK